jgi:hypothetical protein
VKTTAPEATVSHTSTSASLCVALRLKAGGPPATTARAWS